MFKLSLFLVAAAFCSNLQAQSIVQKQLKPYIVISGPQRLNEARVNIEYYTPNSKNYSRSEINFGDGSSVSTLKDAYHNYTTDGSFLITVKTWDSNNVVTTYSETVIINNSSQVLEIQNSSVLNIAKAQVGKVSSFSLSDVQATKLYKLTLAKTPISGVRRTFPPCRSVGSNVSVNGIAIFKSGEFTCSIAQMQRFVVLSKSNTLQFETGESTAAYNFNIEIHEVEITQDVSPPVISSDVQSNTLTRSSLGHISVTDDSSVTTYVWNNLQVLQFTTTEREFDLTLAEGDNNFVLQSVDIFNNKSAYFYLTAVKLDTIVPNLNVLLASEYIYNTYPQTVTVSINSDEDLQALTINNIAATMLTARTFTYLVTVNQPGILELNIKAFDLAGNETIKDYAPIFSIENTPPVISSSLVSGSYTNQSLLQITITDNSETVSEVFLGGLLVNTTNQKIFNVNLAVGLNQILIKSKDIYNNEAQNLSLTINLDLAAPILAHDLQPTYYISALPAQVFIKFTANEPLSSFEFENQPIIAVNGEYKLNKVISQNGLQNFNVRAVDLAGNIINANYSFNAIFDNTAPLIGVNVPDRNFSNANSFPVVVNIEDTAGVNTQIYLNSTLVNSTTLKSFTYSAPIPTDGDYTIEFKSTDLAGNLSVKTLIVTKDTQVLTLEILSPLNGSIFSSQVVDVSFRTNKAIKKAFVNGMEVPISADMKSAIFEYSIWDAGVFTLLVRVEDQFGGTIEKSVQGEIRLSAATAWNYAECPVE